MKAIEEILRKTKYDGATGTISVYVSDLESIHEEFEQLQKENEELKDGQTFFQLYQLKREHSEMINKLQENIIDYSDENTKLKERVKELEA